MTLLLIQMMIVLLVALTCGWIARKLGQARVIGFRAFRAARRTNHLPGQFPWLFRSPQYDRIDPVPVSDWE